jgi:acyl-ACP thioesterase
VIEFVPLSDQGRRYQESFVVRLGDANEVGLLRLDAAARFLQDVATDDWVDTGVVSDDTWVVRRTALHFAAEARWPRYLDEVTLTTWCGGTGAAWAERRTNVVVGDTLVLEAAALWVPIDRTGHPVRMRSNFFEIYGESARERKVSGRVGVPVISEAAVSRLWPLRRADLDIVGHVNNAAVWQAVSEMIPTPVANVTVIHHASIEFGDDVTLLSVPGELWLCVEGVVKVSAQYELV